MRKILLCTNVFEHVTNGPAKFANLLLEINELNHPLEARILTEDVRQEQYKVFKVEMSPWIKRSHLGQFVRMFLYHKRAMEIRRIYPFDVIIYNHALLALWSSLWFKPVIGMVNDDNNSSVSIAKFSFTYRYVKQLIFKQFEKIATSSCSTIIVNSIYLLNHIIQTYPSVKSKTVVLYKAIDLSAVKRKSSFLIDKEYCVRVLFVKNDFLRGGIDILFSAIRRLPMYKFEVTVIGPSPADEQQLKALISSSNIRLNFLGQQPQQFIFNEMLAHDIFCVPSKKEALGVANIEAMASGIAVVSSNAGGIPEVLDQGKAGWMSVAEDVDSLAGCLKECIENDALRRDKIQYSFEQVKKFGKEKMFERLIEILKQVGK